MSSVSEVHNNPNCILNTKMAHAFVCIKSTGMRWLQNVGSTTRMVSFFIWEAIDWSQGLSQDLETGSLKLAIVKYLGVQIFKGHHNILRFQL